MTLPGNGTTKRILATLVAAIVIFLAGAVLNNSNRVTALETDMKTIKETLKENRVENRDEHKVITDKLDAIVREVKK